MSNPNEEAYRAIVRQLQEHAKDAPYVTQDWILQVASMDPMDMRRRLLVSFDWSGHFTHSLDGIHEIQGLPGSGIDGCRMHREVRACVTGLIDKQKKLQSEIDSLKHLCAQLWDCLDEAGVSRAEAKGITEGGWQ